jgi:hypothetical protein
VEESSNGKCLHVVLFYYCSYFIYIIDKPARLFLHDIPGCGKFRKQCLQNIDELELCFRSITNIGIDH